MIFQDVHSVILCGGQWIGYGQSDHYATTTTAMLIEINCLMCIIIISKKQEEDVRSCNDDESFWDIAEDIREGGNEQ